MPILVILLVSVTLSMLTPAAAHRVTRSAEIALAICAMARDNNTPQLQQKLLELRLRLRDIYPTIRCNERSLMQFAVSHNATDIARYLASYANLDDLQLNGDLDWLRQGNLMNSSIGDILRQRLHN